MTRRGDRHGGSNSPGLPPLLPAAETPYRKPIESAPSRAHPWIRRALGLALLVPSYVVLTLNYSDNESAAAILAFPAVVLGTLLVVVLVSQLSLSSSSLQRNRRADVFLVYFLALLLWLDAGVIVLDLGLMAGGWWMGYLVFAVLTPGLLLCISGWRPGDRKRALQRGVLLWFAVALVPFVPWNDNKREGMLVRSIYGLSLEVLQERMDGMQVTLVVETPKGDQTLYGTAGVDFDVPTLNPRTVAFHSMGYCDMTIEDRRITDVFFPYD